MNTQTLRRKFLHYFREQGHTIVPSSSVVPHEDPTLLFINAGMNQFKDVFLGQSEREYTRACTSQKCIRVGGKHNDLENVGHTSRHLTFFEMLGNFSFGDYFKEEAIRWAWELSVEVFGFDGDRIWPSVYEEDDEAFELWKTYVPEKRICRFGASENYWAMGDTGPCGPCSELLYDRGADYGDANHPQKDPTGERYPEFWNLVFMQFNTLADGSKTSLPKPSIDTGAGLERVEGFLSGYQSVFETDILRSLIDKAEEVSGVPYKGIQDVHAPAYHVIADHLRALSFAIADGVQPSNVDRGYVLRKILRRAVRYGRTLGLDKPFLARVLPRLVDKMGEDFPELLTAKSRIEEILTTEEEAFLRTLKRGGNILNQIIEQSNEQISGDDAFKLKDTYGLPLDEILLIARDAELTVDTERFDQLEEEARERSRRVHKTTQQVASESVFVQFVEEKGTSQFVGYQQLQSSGRVLGIIQDDARVESLHGGQEGMVILDRTPFYAEKGGQVGDTGVLFRDTCRLRVLDTQEPYKGVIAHHVKVEEGEIRIGEQLEADVDASRRQEIANNHTATHLIHWALQQVLGEHVRQAGSVVTPERLRFDFSHHKAMTAEELLQVEKLVNCKVRENLLVKDYELSFDEVQKRQDIKQFFGDKYGKTVRVIDIEDSKELCGGTHTSRTGNIGYVRIVKESSIAAGVRRIEAVSGRAAEIFAAETDQRLQHVADMLKTPLGKLEERIEKVLEENKQLLKEIEESQAASRQQLVQELLQQAKELRNNKIVVAELPLDAKSLRACMEEMRERLSSGIIVLGSREGESCSLVASVSDDLVARGIKAGEIIKTIAPLINGGGGGRPQMAQAGGKAPDKLPEALDKSKEVIKRLLSC